MKYLSIIIPVYNMEKYLPECLASLQKQNFDDSVEILLLDDGSKDSSGAICDKIAEDDTHFRVFHQENRGVAATRNRGLEVATGKYIAWVDPDDYITDDWWQVLQPVLAKNPDMVYFDMLILEDGKLIESHFDTASRIIGRDELFAELANGNRIMSHLWSKIFLRTLFDQNGVRMRFNEKMSYCEDYQLLHRLTFPVRECVYLHNCLYVYRQLSNSIVHDKTKTLTNAWLGVELSTERRDFYRSQGVQVSDFGVLYAKLSFCWNCRALGVNNQSQQLQQHYHDCIMDLRKSQLWLLRQPALRLGLKVRLILLIDHLYFLQPVLKTVKELLKGKY